MRQLGIMQFLTVAAAAAAPEPPQPQMPSPAEPPLPVEPRARTKKHKRKRPVSPSLRPASPSLRLPRKTPPSQTSSSAGPSSSAAEFVMNVARAAAATGMEVSAEADNIRASARPPATTATVTAERVPAAEGIPVTPWHESLSHNCGSGCVHTADAELCMLCDDEADAPVAALPRNDCLPNPTSGSRIRKKCPHGRRRSHCKECGGASICEHGRQRSQCKECGGASICEHGRRRSQCKECGGASICEHGRQRGQCKECGGASVCEHGRERSKCKECGGASICEHGRLRGQCADCLSKDQQLKSGIFCLVCNHLIGRNRMLKHGGPGVCAECDGKTAPRTEHLIRPKLLALVDEQPSTWDKDMFGGDCDVDRWRRPDALWPVYAADDARVLGTVKFGCDEDSHDRVPPGKSRAEHIQCELGKVGNQFESIVQRVYREDVLRAEQSRARLSERMLTAKAMEAREDVAKEVPMRGIPQFYIKWNPDAYDKARVPLDERIVAISKHINELMRRIRADELGDDFDVSRPHVSFHYYHSKCDDMVQAFRENPMVVPEEALPLDAMKSRKWVS